LDWLAATSLEGRIVDADFLFMFAHALKLTIARLNAKTVRFLMFMTR